MVGTSGLCLLPFFICDLYVLCGKSLFSSLANSPQTVLVRYNLVEFILLYRITNCPDLPLAGAGSRHTIPSTMNLSSIDS
jgi:hypothetical protein